MGRNGDGVEIRDNSMRLTFAFEGEQRKETLRTDGKPMPPTPANVKYARRLAGEIRDKIRHGTFIYADYFPASPNATTGQGATTGDRIDTWLDGLVGMESSTLKGYRIAAAWWKARLGKKPVRTLVKSDLLAALATEPRWTGKTRNNKMSVMRQVLQLAVDDGILKVNPATLVDAFEHQAPEPDPFDQDEAEALIAGLARHYDEQVARYFGAKFFTGLRTNESLPQRWDWVDWRLKTLSVSGGLVMGELKANTKTNQVRHVQLNSRALAYYTDQKASTFLQPHGLVFPDPRTGAMWIDDEPPRELYWRPCLKRLGIRYRSPYQTRHTYATMMLMAGMTPAFCARQMGHSVEVFLRKYAKWIDGGRNDVEMAKLEAHISLQLPRRSENAR